MGLTQELTKELYGEAKMGHGGEPMGSLWTYLFPGTVDLGFRQKIGARRTFSAVSPAGCRASDLRAAKCALPSTWTTSRLPLGSLSDRLLASAERGERIVNEAIDRLVRFMEWFKGIDPRVEAR